MSLILNIDTSTSVAYVSIATQGNVIQSVTNANRLEHAAFLHVAIGDLLKANSIHISQLDAVAVIVGPGSYTGLRIALSTAKGLCYALHKPLVILNSLEVLVYSATNTLDMGGEVPPVLFCPMLDAVNMEVFTAVYDRKLTCLEPPSLLIINELSFQELLDIQPVIFLGSGTIKWKKICIHPNAIFEDISFTPEFIPLLSARKYAQFAFSDMAYIEPLYLKEPFISVKGKP